MWGMWEEWVQAVVMVMEVTGGGGGDDEGSVGVAVAAEEGGDLERSPHRLRTSCL